jgi:hypothetical protein
MLPLSCFLFWLSKSNSSTRFPSTTTTRVSSAWAASISIFLDIKSISEARRGRSARALPDCHEGARAAASRVVETDDAGVGLPDCGLSGAAHCVFPRRASRALRRGSDDAPGPRIRPDTNAGLRRPGPGWNPASATRRDIATLTSKRKAPALHARFRCDPLTVCAPCCAVYGCS